MHFVSCLRNLWRRKSHLSSIIAQGDPGPVLFVRLERKFDKRLERRYDNLGPVPFARQVTEFAYRLGKKGQYLSQDGLKDALVEYHFLQDRLSFWLSYNNKPPNSQTNLISAALVLYEGGVNVRIVAMDGEHGDAPQSWLLPPPEQLRSML